MSVTAVPPPTASVARPSRRAKPIATRGRTVSLGGRGALAVGAIAYPLLVNQYWQHVGVQVLATTVAALGLAVLTGQAGQVSLAQGAFVGAGGYGAAIAAGEWGAEFPVAVAFGTLVALVLGVVSGLPALRMSRLYLAVATFALHYAGLFAVKELDVTGRSIGLSLPAASIGSMELDTRRHFYWLLLGLVALVAWMSSNWVRARTGRALAAVRDRDVAAVAVGVDVTRYKIIAFALASAVAGASGAVNAYYFGLISPDTYPINLSIQLITIVVVGGVGSLSGAVIGSIVLTLLPELLRELTKQLESSYPRLGQQLLSIQTGVYGAILVAVLLLRPDGLVGIGRQLRRWAASFPYGNPP